VFDEVIMSYEVLSDDELIEMLFEGTVVDTMAVAVLLKRIYERVKTKTWAN